MVDVDKIISALCDTSHFGDKIKYVHLPEQDILDLCTMARNTFLSEPVLLDLKPPLNICGDIHGQYSDLVRLFQLGKHPPASSYLFLGDYVDRGPQSIEVICLLFAYKVRYPSIFYLLRGNHESSSVSMIYGFYEECKSRYTVNMWQTFMDSFNCMPVAAVVGDKIFCCHGGISPDLRSLDDVRAIERPTDVPEIGLLCDLLWSDPDHNVLYWGKNTERAISVTYGSRAVKEFLANTNLELICRAHQMVNAGYEFFIDREVITVFSAPNYIGHGNDGAIMCVDRNMVCSLLILKPWAQERKARAPSRDSLTVLEPRARRRKRNW
ncbi:uncharacterized protein LOC134530059 [Bacillus rossius redtenbacheri]|uniref:uncharacterized protein LOC134530059 n=1 Tax=Bacillus rossius redtenbacheri TaxID=93214 RepID=UPI002FDD346B